MIKINLIPDSGERSHLTNMLFPSINMKLNQGFKIGDLTRMEPEGVPQNMFYYHEVNLGLATNGGPYRVYSIPMGEAKK